MVRRKSEQIITRACIRNGNGEAELRKLLNGEEEMYGKGKMFNILTLEPGVSIGEHQHNGDNEIFCFLSGKGTYNDNGTYVTVEAGDVAVCNSGEIHSLANDGTEPLVFVALILY